MKVKFSAKQKSGGEPLVMSGPIEVEAIEVDQGGGRTVRIKSGEIVVVEAHEPTEEPVVARRIGQLLSNVMSDLQNDISRLDKTIAAHAMTDEALEKAIDRERSRGNELGKRLHRLEARLVNSASI